MRGVFIASEIVAKLRIASIHQLATTPLPVLERILTNNRHNLRLEPKLVTKPTGHIADPPAAIVGHIRHAADVVKHVPAGEEQDGDERDRGPQVAAVQHGLDDRERELERGQGEDHGAGGGAELGPVEGADDARRVRGVHGDEARDDFGFGLHFVEFEAEGRVDVGGVGGGADAGREEVEDGGGGEL